MRTALSAGCGAAIVLAMMAGIDTGGNSATATASTTTPTPTSPAAVANLSGEWESSDYQCPGGKKHTERVRITQDGTRISAVKTLGDDCIQTGHESFNGTLTGNSGKVRWWKGSPGVKPILFTTDVDLAIQDANTFVVSDPPGSLKFVRTTSPNS